MGFFSVETAERTLQGYEVLNMIRKGQLHGVGREPSRIRSPASPACLEWPSKLNRKVSPHVHGIPPRFFATQPFFLHHYRKGVGTAWHLGLRLGEYCLGCCWALMLVMFGVGVGNLAGMAALTGAMVIEKTALGGKRLSPFIGVMLLLLGVLTQSPEQDTRHRQRLPLLEREPEWHDGEIVVVYPLQEPDQR
jgi:hypothetical protein